MHFGQFVPQVCVRRFYHGCLLLLLVGLLAPIGATAATGTTIAPFLLFASGEDSPPPRSLFPGISPTPGTPPDSHGAVGPNHVMTHVNGRSVVRDRAGNLLSSIDLVAFWASLGVNDVFDPKVLYDHYTGRFIATACAQRRASDSGMLFGISATSDPTGVWHLWLLDADNTNKSWVDFPSIGLTADRITISGNMFTVASDNFTGVNLWVIDKTTAMDGGSFNKQLLKVSNAGGTLVPVHTYDADIKDQYIIRAGTPNLFGTGRVQLYSITGDIGSLTFVQNPTASLGPPWSISQPDAPQLGSLSTIETNDDRILSAVIRNGSLWAVHTVALSTTLPTHTAVQWWRISPFSGAVIEVGQIEDLSDLGVFDILSGRHFYFPSVAVNSLNDVLIGFSGSSPREYVSAYYTFRPGDADEFQVPYRYRAGEGIYGGPRWGDYSQTVVDPVDDRSFWTVQQLALGSHQTANYWAQMVELESDTTPPQVAGAIATSSTAVQVTFNEFMRDNAALVSTVNYAINPATETISITRLGESQISIKVPEMRQGQTYTVHVNPNGPQDLAGNTLTHSGNKGVFTGVGVPPTAAITRTGPSPTNLNTVPYSVVFSESVGATFTSADVTVTGSLSAGAAASVTGGPTNFTVHVTPANPNGNGTLGITLGTGIADIAGNPFAGGSASSTYTLDNTPPAITVNSLLTNDSTPRLTGTISEAPATANLTVGGQPKVPTYHAGGTWSLADNALSSLADGIYNVVVTATDAAGNTGTDSTSNELTIDTKAPVITRVGEGTVRVACGQPYADPGVTAWDNRDGDRTAFVVTQGLPVNTSAPGAFQVTYNVSDSAGNLAAPVVRQVIVEDTQPPVIQLTGANPLVVLCGAGFTDPGATATDSCQGNLTGAISKSGDTVDTNSPGQYNITYTVSDAAGNTAAVSRTVIVESSDIDGDGLSACEEASLGTSATNADSDGDGLPDGTEVSAGTDPLDDTSFVPTVYVDIASGSDATGFGTQSAPWATIPHAIELVQGSADTTITIQVARGTYTILSAAGGPLAPDSHEHMLGGFNPSDWSRNVESNTTILDASRARAGSPAQNVVVFDSIANAVLDGFSVTGADATGDAQSDSGAIRCADVGQDVKIVNCLIYGNRAGSNGSGGINLVDASPEIARCTIAANVSEGDGGGIGVRGGSYPVITRCVVSGNDAEGGGGGIYAGAGSLPTITNTVISGNAAPSWLGGGLLIESDAVLANCSIAHNVSVAVGGGGVAIIGGHPLFMNCLFTENDEYGIAQMSDGAPLLAYCLFDSNAAAPYYDYNNGSPRVLASAGEINSGVPSASGNLDGESDFLLAPAGTWSAVPVYNASANRTTLTDSGANFEPGALRGEVIALSADRSLQALVLSNTATTLDVLANYVDHVAVGAPYAMVSYELDAESVAIDAGADASAPEYGVVTEDLLGTARGFDGDGLGASGPDGSDYDIGAYERNRAATANAITITSPNGGESYALGQMTEIAWSFTGDIGSTVRIVARKGVNSGTITNAAPNVGSYTWQIPTRFPLGPGMYIEISSVAHPDITDVSDDTFTITDSAPVPTVTVSAPNGGETFVRGTTLPIRWTSTALEGSNVRILASGGGQTTTIAASTPNGGSFNWSIPASQPVGTDYRVEVQSLLSPTVTDTSNSTFTIQAPTPAATLTVVSPNGGESYTQGGSVPISWTSTGLNGTNVQILARIGGQTTTIAASTPNDGSQTWTIPAGQTPGTGYVIEVRSLSDASVFDTSNAAFTILQGSPTASLTLLTPNGGETIAHGQQITIRWASTGNTGANVKISIRRGPNSGVIEQSTPNTGSFVWQVPSPNYPLGDGMYIEVQSVEFPAILDQSDQPFTLVPAQALASLTFIEPSGGEAFARGEITEITWTSIGDVGQSVKLVARKGPNSGVIKSSTPNDGSYVWQVPTSFPVGPGMYIEISSVEQPDILDSSNTFTIDP